MHKKSLRCKMEGTSARILRKPCKGKGKRHSKGTAQQHRESPLVLQLTNELLSWQRFTFPNHYRIQNWEPSPCFLAIPSPLTRLQWKKTSLKREVPISPQPAIPPCRPGSVHPSLAAAREAQPTRLSLTLGIILRDHASSEPLYAQVHVLLLGYKECTC